MNIRRAASGAATRRGLFVVAFNAANVLNYAFLLAMSRALPSDEFALFASLFGAVYLASALANTVMIATAAAVALNAESAPAIVARVVRRLVLLGVPMALAVAIAMRPAADFLRSDDLVAIGLAGVSLWLLVVASVGYGGLQGSERFGLLGGALIAAAAGRVALGLAVVWFGMGVGGAMLGVAGGLAASAVLALATFAKRGSVPVAATTSLTPLLPALIASLVIAIPTSADVVLVRHYFSAQDAAAYAVMSTLGKVVVFGPLAISLAAFPSMVREHAEGTLRSGTLRRAIVMTAAVAVPSAAAILIGWAAAPGMIFARYDVGFALIAMYLSAMLSFSLVVPFVYWALARRQTAIIAVVPVGLALELALVTAWHPNTASVALVLLVGNLALLAGVAWRCVTAPAGARAIAAGRVFGLEEGTAA